MVYDRWDRLVLTQDSVQFENGEWMFTKYDVLNRPILTGITPHTENLVSDVENAVKRFEDFVTNGSGNIFGYNNQSMPNVTDSQVLSVTYYDNYDYNTVTGNIEPETAYIKHDFGNGTYSLPDLSGGCGCPDSIYVKGLVTGSKTRNLETQEWINTATYYDKKGRMIQTASSNGLTDIDRVSTLYDFVGQVLATYTAHNEGASGGDHSILREFAYDHGGRLISTTHSIDGQSAVTIATNMYNELGQLKEKNLHANEPTKMQSLDYTYNIRGWLTSINESDSVASNDGDFYGMELGYDSGLSGVTSTARFNGNISAMKWSDFDQNSTRAYGYEYDYLNRLKQANPFKGGSSTSEYKVEQLDYDLNGNIKVLKRHGKNSLIDDLSYDYGIGASLSNKLLSVSDAESDTTTFDDKNKSGNDYAYDSNGNMTLDKNKGIEKIGYNHLNLPEKVDFGDGDSLLYYYDAAGIKLKQEVFKDGQLETKREYVGEFYYENDTLRFIQHEEGRIVVDMENSELDYQYHLKDHLGNTRVTFSTTPESHTMKETFETGEENGFTDLHRLVNTNANTTLLGNEVEVLSSGQTGSMGMFQVNKGDTLKVSVMANYESSPSGTGFIEILFSALCSSFNSSYGTGGTEGTGIDGSSSEFDDALSGAGMAAKGDPSTAPRGFLNYIYFNSDMETITSGFEQITTAASGVGVHELVELDPILATEEGYMLVYLSNENQEQVALHFDDLTVVHAKTPIVQMDDYYPFGLTFNSFERSYSEKVRYKFQEQEHDEETGWIAFKWRNHQPEIGRFFNVDPLAETYHYWSPYAFSGNMLTAHRELEGLEPFAVNVEASEESGEIKTSLNMKRKGGSSANSYSYNKGSNTGAQINFDMSGNLSAIGNSHNLKNLSISDPIEKRMDGKTATHVSVSGNLGEGDGEGYFSISVITVTFDETSFGTDEDGNTTMMDGEVTVVASTTLEDKEYDKGGNRFTSASFSFGNQDPNTKKREVNNVKNAPLRGGSESNTTYNKFTFIWNTDNREDKSSGTTRVNR